MKEEAGSLIWHLLWAFGAGVLASVTGSPYAAQKLLAAHSGRLKRAQQQLLKPQNTGVPQHTAPACVLCLETTPLLACRQQVIQWSEGSWQARQHA